MREQEGGTTNPPHKIRNLQRRIKLMRNNTEQPQ